MGKMTGRPLKLDSKSRFAEVLLWLCTSGYDGRTYTWQDVSAHTDIPRSWFDHVQAGRATDPSSSRITALATFFQVDPGALLRVITAPDVDIAATLTSGRIERCDRSMVAWFTPELRNSLFWSAVLAQAVAPDDKPFADPYYGILPLCTQESFVIFLQKMEFAYTFRDRLAAIVIASPAGLPDEDARWDAYVAEIDAWLERFVAAGVKVIVVDRHLPGGLTLERREPRSKNAVEDRFYPTGVVFIGPDDTWLGSQGAEFLIERLKVRYGEEAPIEKIGIIVDDLRLTPQARRLDAARRAIETHINGPMNEQLVQAGKIGSGEPDPNHRNYWNVATRITRLLGQRPYGVLCGSSQLAALTSICAQALVAPGQSPIAGYQVPVVHGMDDSIYFVPPIIAMDSAAFARPELRLGIMPYEPRALVRAIFNAIRDWEIYLSKGYHRLEHNGEISGQPEVDQAIMRLPKPPAESAESGNRAGTFAGV